MIQKTRKFHTLPQNHPGGGGLLGSIFAGYVPLASQNPFPFIVYFMANYRPHLSHFWVNVILRPQLSHFLFMHKPYTKPFNCNFKAECNAPCKYEIDSATVLSVTILFTANLSIFKSHQPEFSHPQNPDNLRPHSSNSVGSSIENATPL